MTEPLPIRLSDGGRVATWNPAMTRAARVIVRVVSDTGAREDRPSMNSGRARVRQGESIEAVVPSEVEHDDGDPERIRRRVAGDDAPDLRLKRRERG